MSEATGAIVVGVDGSEQATSAVRWAAAEAGRRNLGRVSAARAISRFSRAARTGTRP